MNNFLVGLLGALLATNPPAAVSNLVSRETGLTLAIPDANDPVEKEYHKLMEEDDAAHDETDRMIRDAQEFDAKGAKGATDTLGLRVRDRLIPVRKAYEEFIARHPKHARSRIAFGSFLNEQGEEEAAVDQWEKAREADPGIPSVWNNLANYYGHRGPVKKAFEYYAKTMELDPKEAVYFWNLATTVYLFRKDAMEYYKLNETQVFDKALDLYRQALKIDPTNFVLATDYSESFYGTKPPRWADGLQAWEDTIKLARTDVEREGVRIHFARIKIKLGQLEAAQQDLNAVTNEMYLALKKTIQKNLNAMKSGTNNVAVPASAPKS